MQNAKDSFYEWLRARLVAVNAARTVSVRGQLRPGLLVRENELPTWAGTGVATDWLDCFVLAWTGETVTPGGALPLVGMTAEIAYATRGTAANGGMDRGRALGAMDGELLAMVCGGGGMSAPKFSYSDAGRVAMATRIWWCAPVFGEAVSDGAALRRVATVVVNSYEEAGEL